MIPHIIVLLLTPLSLAVQQTRRDGQRDCPLLGPVYPAPRNLASSSIFQAAVRNLSGILDPESPNRGSALDTNGTSFSVNVFSAHDDGDEVLFEYHHEAQELHGSIARGEKLDGDTVYRIASVSKLLVTYAFLIEAGIDKFDVPVARYVPEIADAIENAGDDDVFAPRWEEITLGALAGYMAGIGRGGF